MPLFPWFRRHRAPAPADDARSCSHCGTALPEGARYCFLCGRALRDETPAEGERAADEQQARLVARVRARLGRALDGRFVVRDLLGAGGMGLVFLADDLTLERTVALKVLPPDVARDATVVTRFQREAKTAARLEHPGIIPVYGVESADGLHFFAMKYVAGRSLDAVLREDEPPSVSFTLRVLREAAAALAHAHRHGVVHRDVKPANIMLDEDARVVLTDFGISKVAPTSTSSTTAVQLTEMGTALGTPYYMAPEQGLGQPVDGRADQYALAILGFQMLAGRLPFDGDSPQAIIHRHIHEAPPRLNALRPDVPAPLAAAIARALSKAPSNRYPSMEEFAAALTGDATDATVPAMAAVTDPAGFTRARSTGARVSPVRSATARTAPRPRRRLALASTGAALLAVLALGGWAAWRRGSGPTSVAAPASDSTAVARVDSAPPRQSAAPKPATPARPTSARTATHATSARATTRRTTLSVSATPRATVYLDGKRVGETPVARLSLVVGRNYELSVVRKGYRTKRETIRPRSAEPLHRKYTLQRAR